MNIRNGIYTSGVAALLLLATGCAGSPADSAAGNNGAGSVQAAASPDPQAVTKVDEFLSSNGPAEQARQIAIRDCMAKAGFKWEETVPKQMKVQDLVPLKPLSIEQARSVGYASPQQSQSQEAQNAQTPAAAEAFMGPAGAPKVSVNVLGMKPSVSSKGCLAESYKQVYGSVENGMMATGVTINAVLPGINAAIGDSSVADANKKWSECMTAASYPNLETPDRAWDTARQNPTNADAIAVADAKCREGVSYEDVRKAALNKYLTTFLTRNETLITEIQTIRKEAAANAQKIIAGL
ncbi:hypothetical protein PUN71_021645 [Arthrobacter sp. NQ7]|uniref:hypothetical protein n=1 Tax=Arthrobacter sp. NQ7 TaxID=3032303 RepID=UPI00240FE192|nr:hypothetical protein [Arthrobacter sp. NQ7]MDJ0459816.1 hypothetical protein [Arthrobacter sp. NQ7]